MIKQLISFLFIVLSQSVVGQNCNTYKLEGDTTRYQSCLKCNEAYKHYQFSREFQSIMDSAIEIDPNFYLPYKAKSTAYLKSGDFITWKVLIDKAVECDLIAVLGYRASCRYQFFRDYVGCIKDIEQLDSLVNYDIGEIHNGDYHLNVIKAISYDALGQTTKAIAIMEEHMSQDSFYALLYDYFLLGYFYLKQDEYVKAEEHFHKQKELSDIAENEFYLAKTYALMGNTVKAKKWILSAKVKYLAQSVMFDTYTEPYGKIYLSDIEKLLDEVLSD